MNRSRRSFLAGGLGAGLGLAASRVSGAQRVSGGQGASGPWEVSAFEKIFQNLSYDEIGRRLSGLGFQGIEATVRKGGHIDPARAADELPKAVKALDKHGCKIAVMASNINRADAGSEKLLRIAKAAGVTRYRMEYFRFKGGSSPRAQLEDFQAQVRDLAAMNRELGVQAVYQNHAGDRYMGSVLWDLDAVLDDIPKEAIGVALDLRHAVAESGLSWKTGFALIRPRVAMVYVKDAVWEGKRLVNVPLGTGMVGQETFREAVKGIGPVPVSLHVEYFGGRPLEPAKLGPVMEAHQRDLKTLRGWM